MVNLFVANTDNAWFDFLSTEPNITEVNFWWPGQMAFRAVQPGGLLVFRLKSPRNKIGGFGVFSNYSPLPIQIAWDSFGRANGVSSLDKLRIAIAEYRTDTLVGPMTNIGCTILVDPVFFPSDLGSIRRNRGRAVFSVARFIRQRMWRVSSSGISFKMRHNYAKCPSPLKWPKRRRDMALLH
jgi:hypothetical protein